MAENCKQIKAVAPNQKRMIGIDGSIGEGGGQVLRTALSLSCVLQKGVRISNIRAGRENPGLRAQHLTVCQLLAEISGAKMSGASLGSQEITFEPGSVKGGEFTFDIGTAGSCTLLLQAALPVLLSSEKECVLRIRGGTHVRGAPTYEYFSEVFLPAAQKFGAKCEAKLNREGFYPKGGGEIELRTFPSKLKGTSFPLEEHISIRYSIVSAGIPSHVAEREEEEVVRQFAGWNVSGGKKMAQSPSPGNAVTLWSGCFGASCLGEVGKSAKKVAEEACKALLSEMKAGASVDSHLADQLLLYAALAEGKSSFSTAKFSQHLLTNAGVLRQMTGRNIILGGEGKVEVV